MSTTSTSAAAATSSPAASRARTTAATRNAVLVAASRLFVERGFSAVSVRDIAAEAGISHPAVRRHFASKEEILGVVVDELSACSMARLDQHEVTLDDLPALARHNATIPGYIPLFAALAGEATSGAHPAHERFRERHAEIRRHGTTLLRGAVADGALPAGTDAVGETIRLTAAWDGLALMSLYLPDRVDVPAMLERRIARLRGVERPGAATGTAAAIGSDAADGPEGRNPRDRPDELLGLPALAVSTDDLGYAPGRARRAQILADASTLFAARGFHATSLREIAAQVGVGKSTLLHHFPSKEELLGAVIAQRDATIDERMSEALRTVPGGPTEMLLHLPEVARADAAREPGLIELYAVLSAEAAAVTHPGHRYFERRFTAAIASFSRLFALAAYDVGIALDLEFEAMWLTALWDGLQLPWLYDPDSVDVGDHLDAHLRGLLSPSG